MSIWPKYVKNQFLLRGNNPRKDILHSYQTDRDPNFNMIIKKFTSSDIPLFRYQDNTVFFQNHVIFDMILKID